jgi:hypothetical protein
MDIFAGLLVFAALGIGGFGVLLLSNATFGVGMIGLGCLMAILARMAQASHHHDAHPHPPATPSTESASVIVAGSRARVLPLSSR